MFAFEPQTTSELQSSSISQFVAPSQLRRRSGSSSEAASARPAVSAPAPNLWSTQYNRIISDTYRYIKNHQDQTLPVAVPVGDSTPKRAYIPLPGRPGDSDLSYHSDRHLTFVSATAFVGDATHTLDCGRMRVRIKIREQLSFLVTILALCCVGIPSLISWVKNYHFVVHLRADRLALVAALKADQLSQALAILQNSIASVSSRLLIQGALKDYYAGDRPLNLWDDTITDIAVALETQPYLLQAVLWNRDLNETFANVTCTCALGINGTAPSGNFLAHGFQPFGAGFSWNGHVGFPDSLYPRPYNLNDTEDERLSIITPATIQQFNFTFQGPVMVNETLYLASYTVPVFDQTNNNTLSRPLLGFFTIIVNIQILVDISNRRLGLDETGLMLVVGPDNPTNLWSGEHTSDDKVNGDTMFRFVLPAYEKPDIFDVSGPMSAWTTVVDLYHNGKGNPARADLSVRDISDHRFSVGYILLDVPYLDWGVIIAQDYDEVLAPVIQLRNILLATIFGTLGVVILLVWPLSHIFVRPITRLSAATQHGKRSLSPRGRPDSSGPSLAIALPDGGHSYAPEGPEVTGQTGNNQRRPSQVMKSALGLVGLGKTALLRPVTEVNLYQEQDDSRNTFRIPSKVPERPHIIHDELTELTHKFNRMTEELEVQYETLEERVRQRTVQLEEQRQIAETANEAKSRFIANITHELRTPLNGILGMCAVCLAEDDIIRIKQSLGTVYKSGELLLHLLTDLLTFSRTQIGGQAIPLDIKRFRIADIASQVLAIFEKQAKDSKIQLGVTAIPETTLNDMVVMGDSNRILQIIINLISNALKFTPESGIVHLTITLGNEFKPMKPVPSPVINSRDSSRNRYKPPTVSKSISERSTETPNENPSGVVPSSAPSNRSDSRQQSSIAPEAQPSDPKTYMFEFKVQDTGPGIPMEQQQQIFEPFVQGELGLNRKYGGTGLGLSICKQLATLMSGTITVESQEGVGSAFTLKIPLKHAKDGVTSSNVSSREGSVSLERTIDSGTGLSSVHGSKPSDKALDPTATNVERLAAFPQPRLVGFSQPFFVPTEEPQTVAGGKIALVNKRLGSPNAKNVRVLVAEDNKINQEVVIRMLKLERIENITLADDGIEAVDRIKEAIKSNLAFHIVFMDVQMPNLDGLESTRIIRELGYSAPIIALSALTEESNIKECLESGMNYFLAKPIRRPALKHVLRTYCTPISENEDQEEPASKSPTEPRTP
ncbi:Histidine kinase [Orbilia javanica]|uniref:histidine kinase n=1 Tax=Orbilia javanica TaxID=47235 RepID=A0AAN8MRQ2_9PEZI